VVSTSPLGIAIFMTLAVFAGFQAWKRPPAPPVNIVKVRVVKPIEDRIVQAETRFDHWRGRDYRQLEAY
jgi:hypothetical protein